MPNLTDEMIKVAAKKANIEIEQSRLCVEAAMSYIYQAAKRRGVLDLSEIFPGAYVRMDNTNSIQSIVM